MTRLGLGKALMLAGLLVALAVLSACTYHVVVNCQTCADVVISIPSTWNGDLEIPLAVP